MGAVIILALWMTIAFNGQAVHYCTCNCIILWHHWSEYASLVVGMTRGLTNGRHALASFVGGAVTSIVWVLFVHFKESKLFTGITYDMGVYNFVEPLEPMD